MTISQEQKNETLTLRLEGRLDTITAPELEKIVTELPKDVTALVLDMTDLAYISSAGLRVLLEAQKKMNRRGSMKLIGVGESIMDILEMTGFADILTIE